MDARAAADPAPGSPADWCGFGLLGRLGASSIPHAASGGSLHVAILGADATPTLRGFAARPAPRILVLHHEPALALAEETRERLERSGARARLVPLEKADFETTLRALGAVLLDAMLHAQDVSVNASTSDPEQERAAFTAAYLHGACPFKVDGEEAIPLPRIEGGIARLLGETQLVALGHLHARGARGASPRRLARRMGVARTRLDDALHGTPEREGLDELGLVRVNRLLGRPVRVRLTPQGRGIVLAGLAPATV